MSVKLSKIISAILVIASLTSIFSVFAYAADKPIAVSDVQSENQTEGEDAPEIDVSQIDIIYNRNFEEGWDYNNGFSKFRENTNAATFYHKSYIDFEETPTRKYNYFWRIEATDSPRGCVTTLKVGSIRDSGTVVSLKIKADDVCNLGRIMYMQTPGAETIDLLSISGNTLYAFKSGSSQFALGELTNEWLSITMVFDWDASKILADGSEGTLFKCRVYYGDDGKYLDYENDYKSSKDEGMKELYFGLKENTNDRTGMSFCIDDLAVYQNTKEIVDLGDEEKGSTVNEFAATVIDIQEGPGIKTTEEIIAEALCMKVRVDSALIKNEKKSIANYCSPEIVNGNVMVSLSLLLDFINYPYYIHGESYDITTGTSATYITMGRDTASVDGERIELSVAPGYLTNSNGEQVPVIAVADIPNIFPGWLVTYDDMGLIIVYSAAGIKDGQSLISRDTDLDVMLSIMKKFVFDTVTKDENGQDFEEIELSYIATGEKVISDIKKNSPSHPYLLTNQQTFDKLSDIYSSLASVDGKAQSYLQSLIAEADALYFGYTGASVNVEYPGIPEANKPVNVYEDGKNPDPTVSGDSTVSDTEDGYSSAGTLESIELYTKGLVTLAFAYQVTRNDKYAELAYDISVALGEWTHWGPASMEHCAAATANFAISFDWLYNYYLQTKGQAVVDNLASILYQKGVKQGYNSSKGNICEFPRVIGGGDTYATLTTYVNAVCCSSMIIGAFALVDYSEYSEDSAYLIGNNIHNLIENGLDQYAPDGSYAESAVMWASATNGFVKLIMALESAAGTTYGFEDTWGLDKTFYFACYIEDSDGNIWNYHEGGADGVVTGALATMDTQMFNYAGKFLKDPALISIRKNQLEKGKAVTIFDMLFYPEGEVESDVELSLDYWIEGLQAFVSRSDWNDGALYTGLMGGPNDIPGGQLDSGNFIYRNAGIDWIIDLGSDNKEIYSYDGAYRNHHYRHNAEGQNVIIIASVQEDIPYGQLETGNGIIQKTYSNEYGSYAIINNASAYGSVISYAKRGLLVTNDRKTVVLQDEISMTKLYKLTWIVHTASEIVIGESGNVAYLIDEDEAGNIRYLRATIVSNSEYFFTKEDCEPGNILSSTYKASDYKSKGGAQPYSRDGISRLVINTRNVITASFAVVFELVESMDSAEPLGYTWSSMGAWEPVEDSTLDSSQVVVRRDDPILDDINVEASNLDAYTSAEHNTAYTGDIDEFFYSLTKIAYILKTYPYETLNTEELKASYSAYQYHLVNYEKYMKKINSSVNATSSLTQSMSGMKTQK